MLLVYGYSGKNAGDLAITIGAIDYLTQLGADLVVVSRYDAKSEEYHQSRSYLEGRYAGLSVEPSPFTLDRSRPRLALLCSYIRGAMVVLFGWGSGGLKRAVRDCDRVYFNGGNLFRCGGIVDFLRLLALFYPLMLARRYGREIVILSQSTAKLNLPGRLLVGRAINSALVVNCRERMSYDLLRRYFPNAPLRLSPDMAFFIEEKSSGSQASAQAAVAFTVRSSGLGDIGELSPDQVGAIQRQVTETIRKVTELGLSAVIVVQTRLDLPLSREIGLTTGAQIIEEYDPIVLRGIYRNVKLLVAMRLHAAILALSVGTPCVGYFARSWGLKNPGVLGDLDQPYLFLDDQEKVLSELVASSLSACESKGGEMAVKTSKMRVASLDPLES